MNEIGAMSGKAEESCMALLGQGQTWVSCMDNATEAKRDTAECEALFPNNTQICGCMGAVPEDIAWEFGLRVQLRRLLR